jgi:prepilin-type N-terminal cleavage/methylation domain-containing protein
MKMIHRGEKGFTLIELLIVVAILAIIAAVIIPNIATFMATGEVAAANTEAENVKTAALGYFADAQLWPCTSTDLVNGNYTAGTIKATYFFDTAGFIIAVGDPGLACNDTQGIYSSNYTRIHWDQNPPAGQQKWVRGKP